jgi:hypothetical protein
MNKSLRVLGPGSEGSFKKVFILLFALFSFFLVQSQHKYYFRLGTTEGDGSERRPFNTMNELSRLSLKPGDTVFFHGRDTITANISLENIHGNEKHNIVFASYGKTRSTIDGRNTPALVFTGSDYFQVVNIGFMGSGRKSGNTTDGVKLTRCKNAKIKNVEVSGFQKAGLILYNSETIEVNKVYAHDNGLAGILVEGDYKKRMSANIKIVNCRADNNPGDPTNLDNHSGNGILVGNCKNVLIEYCTATNNGWDMPRLGNGPVGIWAYEADSVIIQHCISYRNKTAKGAADGGGFDLDGGVTNSIIQYCLSYENWGSGYGIFQYDGADKWNNNTVRYSVSINDGLVTDQACGMLIWNGSGIGSDFARLYAYNNFIYNDRKYAFGLLDQSNHEHFFFFNNVFIASDTSEIFSGVDSSIHDIFLGNVWMKKSGGFRQDGFFDIKKWSEETGYEQLDGKLRGRSFKEKLFLAPPQINIIDPYSLKVNSLLLSVCNNLLRNEGIDVVKMFSLDVGRTDFFGQPIGARGSSTPGICDDK